MVNPLEKDTLTMKAMDKSCFEKRFRETVQQYVFEKLLNQHRSTPFFEENVGEGDKVCNGRGDMQAVDLMVYEPWDVGKAGFGNKDQQSLTILRADEQNSPMQDDPLGTEYFWGYGAGLSPGEGYFDFKGHGNGE